MRQIDINDAEEGMILAKDVLNLQGVVLIKAGNALSASVIEKLKKWGVVEVCVEGEEIDELAKIRDKVISEGASSVGVLLQNVENRFRSARGDELMDEIMLLVERHILEKYGERNTGED